MTTTDRATSPSDLAKRTANIATAVEHAKAAIAAATTDLDHAMTELGWAVRGIVERDIADNNTKRQEATTAEAEAEAEASALTQSWDRQGILGEIAAEASNVERDEGWGTYDAAQAIQTTWRLASSGAMDKRLAFIKIAAFALHGVEYIDASEEADPPTPDEHRCPAKVEKWRDNPAYHHLVLQCQLNAGHDGDHRHHGDERHYWPGKGGLTDQYDWVEVDAREGASETPDKHVPPAPVRWLHFHCDAREAIGQTVGPTTLGERLTAVTADYDPATNVTRVGYAYGRLRPEQIANARTAAGLAPIPA